MVTGDVYEDGTLTDSETITVSDVDDDEDELQADTGTGDNGLGDYTVTATGWSYTVDNAAIQHLGAGDTATDTFTITSADGTDSETVTITIHGENDEATISGVVTGDVYEDGTLTAGGTLTVTDPDAGENAFQAVPLAALAGVYGSFAFNEGTGEWTYLLDNDDADLLTLDTGETAVETLTVYSIDGTSHTVNVTVHGTDEPVLRAAPTDIGLIVDQPGSQTNMNFNFGATLVATDPDTGAFTYKFSNNSTSVSVGGNTFNIGGVNGDRLTSTSSLNNNQDYSLEIVVTQAGDSSGMSYTETFHIITGSGSADNVNGSGDDTDDVLYGSNGNDIVFGLAGNDALFGQSGTDQLTGGTGADSLYGGDNNDTLFGDQDDTLLDGEAGTDTLSLAADFTSSSNGQIVNVENVVLTAAVSVDLSNQTEAFTITGSSGNDTIIAGSGGDTINGGAGNDNLTGNTGNDSFNFTTALNAATNVDTIADFNANNADKIRLDDAIFAGIANSGGSLNSNDFDALSNGVTGTAASTVNIIFDTSNGNLYYDSNGANTTSGRTLFATISLAGLTGTVDNTDFIVI